MTTRAVDYAVLGQAGFLAAGLTTVFCNAVGNVGRGQSCFIGHDGWDKEGPEDDQLSGAGPYHGPQPGIFRPWHRDRGWLGAKEQALVIADVDPFYASEGKPRPQMLPTPLELVGHLPIVEYWRNDEVGRQRNRDCRCGRDYATDKCERDDVESLVKDFVKDLLIALTFQHMNTIQDLSPSILAKLIKRLAKLSGNNEWLTRRSEAYKTHHAANPQAWPPPAALDWLLVDLGERDPNNYPLINVPEYCGD